MPTDALVGKRVQYVYSQTEAYEHIYLNENLYTWQCLRGSEAGLADTDRCHYRRIADELYLFVWREKVVPTLGVVLGRLGGQALERQDLRLRGQRLRGSLDHAHLLARDAPERHHLRLIVVPERRKTAAGS